MSIEITSVSVDRLGGQKKFLSGKRVPDKVKAQQRFKKLKPNLLYIEGENLKDLKREAIKLKYDGFELSFAILEVVPDVNGESCRVYYLAWSPKNADFKIIGPENVGDLTVTVETVTSVSTDACAKDEAVTVEEAQ